MAVTFGRSLKSLALAADNIDIERFNRLMKMCQEYLNENFQIVNLDILSESVVNQNRGLSPIITEGVFYSSYEMYDDDGKPNGACSYSFLTGRKIWVVPKKSETNDFIGEGIETVDLLSNNGDNPKPLSTISDECKSIIAIPIREGKTTKVVVYFESSSILQPMDSIVKELSLVAESLAIINSLVCEFKSRSNNTDYALEDLNKLVRKHKIFDFVKPSLFVAYSSLADAEVIGILRTTLNYYIRYLNPIFWEDISRSGEIDQQVFEAIRESKGAICYFSEPMPEDMSSEFLYEDNHNVLFEAGLVHALVFDEATGPLNWIPMREPASMPPPFDFRNLRFLAVPRLQDGTLNRNELEANIRRRVESFLTLDLGNSVDNNETAKRRGLVA